MKLLAMDSSGNVASVALLEEDKIIGEYSTNHKKTHSQTLLPMLDTMLEELGITLEEVDAFTIAAGPGSFTGLRIGAATVKGLAYALQKPIISIPTVEGLAFNLAGTDAYVVPLMDARRAQVYTGVYCFEAADHTYRMKELVPQCAIPVAELMEKVNALGHPVIFLGDGVPVYEDQIRELCKVDYSFAPQHMNRQRAAAVAALAYQKIKPHLLENGTLESVPGLIEDAYTFAPEYLRLSQAEREKKEREKEKA